MRTSAAAILLLFIAAPALAHQKLWPARDFTYDGDLTQGGLVTGRTEPGTRLSLDGRGVRVGADGTFAFGFGRDAKPKARLAVVFPDGERESWTLSIARRSYKISRIDGLPPKMVTPGAEDMKRITAEHKLISRTRRLDTDGADFTTGFRWPVRGRISGIYGSQRVLNGEPRNPHLGVDIAAPQGTPVLAPAAGVVALVHRGMYFTGKTVVLDHGHGVTSIFAHMSAVGVEKGRRVRRGDPIGKVGMTGRSTGPHLHWGMNWFKVRLDPALLAGPMRRGKAAKAKAG